MEQFGTARLSDSYSNAVTAIDEEEEAAATAAAAAIVNGDNEHRTPPPISPNPEPATAPKATVAFSDDSGGDDGDEDEAGSPLDYLPPLPLPPKQPQHKGFHLPNSLRRLTVASVIFDRKKAKKAQKEQRERSGSDVSFKFGQERKRQRSVMLDSIMMKNLMKKSLNSLGMYPSRTVPVALRSASG